MAVVYAWPLTSTFIGVHSLGANGISHGSGHSAADGIGTQWQIVDGWALATLSDTDAVTNGGQRTELAGDNDPAPCERLYRWEYRLEGVWPYDSTAFVIMQIHSDPSGAVVAENFWLTCDGRTVEAMLPTSQPGDVLTYSRIAAWPAVVGQVVAVALHVRWDKTTNRAGWIDLYVNGVLMASVRNRATAYSHAEAGGGPYYKVGVYMPAHAYSGWGVRSMSVRNVIVTDGLNGESWTALLGDIPRPVPWAVGP